MRAKSIALAITFVTAAVALAFAGLALRSSRQIEASVAAMGRMRAGLEVRVKAVEARVATSNRNESALRALLGKTQDEPADGRERLPVSPRPDLTRLMAQHPEVRAAFMKSFRDNMPLKFLPFYQALGLTSTQIRKFEDLTAEHQEETLDLQAAIQAQGLTADDPGIAALRQQQSDQLREAETEVLGNSGYKQLEQFTRAQPLEGAVSDVASFVVETSPLSASQMTQLLNVLANSSSKFQAGGTADVLSVDASTVLARANQFLTPTQYAALKTDTELWKVGGLMQKFYQMQPATK